MYYMFFPWAIVAFFQTEEQYEFPYSSWGEKKEAVYACYKSNASVKLLEKLGMRSSIE